MSIDTITHVRAVVTRCDAKQAGLPTFYLGKLCNNGHRAERFTSNMKCVECHNGVNPDRTRTASENKARLAAKADCDRDRNLAAKRRRIMRRLEAMMRSTARKSVHVRGERYRRADGAYTAQDIMEIHDRQQGICVYCRADLDETGFHVDHIFPLAKGGSNWPRNLQLACPKCNMAKSAKHPADFAAQVGVPFTLDVRSLMSEWAINAQF